MGTFQKREVFGAIKPNFCISFKNSDLFLKRTKSISAVLPARQSFDVTYSVYSNRKRFH